MCMQCWAHELVNLSKLRPHWPWVGSGLAFPCFRGARVFGQGKINNKQTNKKLFCLESKSLGRKHGQRGHLLWCPSEVISINGMWLPWQQLKMESQPKALKPGVTERIRMESMEHKFLSPVSSEAVLGCFSLDDCHSRFRARFTTSSRTALWVI